MVCKSVVVLLHLWCSYLMLIYLGRLTDLMKSQCLCMRESMVLGNFSGASSRRNSWMRSWLGTCLGRRGGQWRNRQKLRCAPRCVSRIVAQFGRATAGFVTFSFRIFSFLLPSSFSARPALTPCCIPLPYLLPLCCTCLISHPTLSCLLIATIAPIYGLSCH